MVYRKSLNETSFDNSKYVLYDPMSLFHGRWQQGEPVKQPQDPKIYRHLLYIHVILDDVQTRNFT